jgi:hypothetical protein
MNISRIHNELYNGPEHGFTKTGIELWTKEGIVCFRYSDLLRFNKLELEIGARNYGLVINAIKAKIKIPGIYSSDNGHSLSYLKLNNYICIISHEEIQPDAFKIYLEGIISEYNKL